MRRVILGVGALVIFATGVAAGGTAGYFRWHEPFDRFADARRIIMNRAEDAPTGGVLLIGDSIVHRLHLSELCGLPVFNAGMSGARADQIAPIVDPLVAELKPRFIILSAGTNDDVQGDAWRGDIKAMQRPGMMTITPDDRLPEAMLSDGVHPNAAGRVELKRRMTDACERAISSGRAARS